MKKYLYIYKSEIMSSLQYIFNILLNMVGYTVLVFIFFNLWDYIYEDASQLINGYTKNQMIWYIIVTEMLWQASGARKLCRKICEDVRGGNIAYNINKPYSYIGYVISSHLGEMTIKALITIIVGIIFGMIFLNELPQISLIGIIIVLISAFLSILINTILVTAIGLLSFTIEDASPIYWLYSKVILILGTMFPMEFFPKIIQTIVRFSPIYAISYGPARLFVNFDIKNAVVILITQMIYVGIALGISNILYKKGVKKLNVNGG